MNIFRKLYAWIAELLSSFGHRDKHASSEQQALVVLRQLDRKYEKGTSTFNPESPQAIAGLAFQTSVFEELQKEFPNNETFEETWDYFKKQDPSLSIYELACLEKEWGDITFVHEGQRFWVECCFAMGEKNSWFCEMKRKKFRGVNKFYCWGKRIDPGKTWYIPSRPWNDYVEQCKTAKKGKKTFRIVPVHLIGDNIRVAKRGADAFAKYIN
jgi:hypothetical protein